MDGVGVCDPAVTFAPAIAEEEFGGAFLIPSLRPDDCRKDTYLIKTLFDHNSKLAFETDGE